MPAKSVFRCGIACEPYAEFLENFAIDFAQHNCGVCLTSVEQRKLFKGTAAHVVMGREHRECHQHLVGVEPGVVAAEIFGFGFLYRLDKILRNKFHAVVNACQVLNGV